MLDLVLRFRRCNVKVSYFGAAKAFFYDNISYEHNIHSTIYGPFLAAIRQYEKLCHLIHHCRFTDTIASKYNVIFVQFSL